MSEPRQTTTLAILREKTGGAWLVRGVLGSALLGGACGHSGPPPRPAEVPIDTAPPSGTFIVPAGETTTSTEIPVSTGATPGGPTPTAVTTTPSAADPGPTAPPAGATPPVKKAPVPKAQRLTAADCSKLMDKYVGLVAISQGVAPDQVKNVLPMMKQQVASDPNYTAAQTSCIAENSKKQFACAMKTTTVDAWKACLE